MEPPKLDLSGTMPSYGPRRPWCELDGTNVNVHRETEWMHRHLDFSVSTLNELIARLETEDVTDQILKHINEQMYGELTRELLGLKDGERLTADRFIFID
jgi:hypothetical protein